MKKLSALAFLCILSSARAQRSSLSTCNDSNPDKTHCILDHVSMKFDQLSAQDKVLLQKVEEEHTKTKVTVYNVFTKMDELSDKLETIGNVTVEQTKEPTCGVPRYDALLRQLQEEQNRTRATVINRMDDLQDKLKTIVNVTEKQKEEQCQAASILLHRIEKEQNKTKGLIDLVQEKLEDIVQKSEKGQNKTRGLMNHYQENLEAIVYVTQEQTKVLIDAATQALLQKLEEEQTKTRANVDKVFNKITSLESKLNVLVNATDKLQKRGFIEKNCTCPTTKHEAPPAYASHCLDVYNRGDRISGVYTINTPECKGEAIQVFCDMEADNGGPGWIIIQRRQDGSVSFNRTWSEYRQGFGNLSGEHWLGNRYLERITKSYTEKYELRIDLWDWQGDYRFAQYSSVRIMDEFNKYKLVLGTYSGDAGDSLALHKNKFFSTPDMDNDGDGRHCARIKYWAGWWYQNCGYAFLNNPYHSSSPAKSFQGISWYHWRGTSYSLKKVQMKIRPVLN